MICLIRLIISGLVALSCSMPHAWAQHSKLPTNQPTNGTVLHVIDGDTIVARIDSTVEHVRLIGIDTPESRPNRRSELQAERTHTDQKKILSMGHAATTHAQKLLPRGSAIKLEFDLDRRDRYQRLLAYVWRADGTMANEEIIRAGYAYLLTVPPNVRYRERFALAFSDAQAKRRGLWATSGESGGFLR